MATTNPTDLTNAISEIIEEDLSPGVRESTPKLDSLYPNLASTFMGVSRDHIGRDWKVIHTLIEGLSGAFKWADPGGTQPSQWGTSSHIINPGAAEEFPGLDETTNPGFVQKVITLVKGMGNMFVPHEFLRADKLDASIHKAVSAIIRGTAQNVMLSEIHAFYATDSFKSVGTVGAVTTAADVATIEVRVGAVRGFYSGLHIDIYNSAGTTQRNTGVMLVVDGVRYIPEASDTGYGHILVRRKDLGTIADLNIAATDLIIRKDSLSKGPLGPEQWLINTGTIFDNIDVSIYEQFKSIIDTSISAVLTEKLLNQFWGRFFKAYGMEHMPDCIVTSMGVTNAHAESRGGLGRIQRAGATDNIVDGFEMGEEPFVFNGRNVMWKVSAFMPSTSNFDSAPFQGGRLWGLKLRDQNIVRYLPPPVPGSKTDSLFGSEVEFVYPIGGPMGIFKPFHSTAGKATNYQEAPFYHWVAVAPEFIPGILLGGLTETL